MSQTNEVHSTEFDSFPRDTGGAKELPFSPFLENDFIFKTGSLEIRTE